MVRSAAIAAGWTLPVSIAAVLPWLVLSGVISFGAEPGAAAPEPIYYFDLTDLNSLDLRDPVQARQAWDTLHLVASVQGIVNRDRPALFIRFMKHPDDFWWDYLREEGNWLAGRPVRAIGSIEQLLETFQGQLRGVVVDTETLPATSNLASTIAGVENRVCLRHDTSPQSVYARVMKTGLPLTQDAVRLFGDDGAPLFSGKKGTVIAGTGQPGIPSTGSAKCDAYLWAKHRYLDPGLTSPRDMAYYIDSYWLRNPAATSLSNCTLSNHDFFIARKAFFFDLGVWEEESPVDDPGQTAGTDLGTLKVLLRAMHDRAGGKILHIGGFTPWIWKYTDHAGAGSKHGGVDTEWKYAQTISAYNGVMDADALGYSGMANASFYQHFPLKDRYPQHRKPTLDDLKAKGLLDDDGRVAKHSYVTFYMGDYDSSAWLNYHVPLLWADPARGTIPCGWAFNPNLDRRAPQAVHYARTRATEQDWFVAGDCGAGYLNPGMLGAPRLDPDVPDGWEAWIAHSREYFRRYDLSITGFIIDGHAPGMGTRGLDAYLQFSPDGIVGQKIPQQGLHRDTMPMIRMRLDLYGSPPEAGRQLAGLVGEELPQFMVIRTILQSPTWHKETMAHAQRAPKGDRLRFLDPYTFFLLLKSRERQ
ncbi:MAG: GxGYxYP family putative glycoside hydrolase [Planctomycetia bacterium]|nr:GxGYxYP family putative glycoside hydrolase [Planctomycetia bacterium]